MLLALLLAAVTDTAAEQTQRASTHEVARRLGIPWRTTPAVPLAFPRTRIELWAHTMRRLYEAHPESIPSRKTGIMTLFLRLNGQDQRIQWKRKVPNPWEKEEAKADLDWIRKTAGSDDLRAVFFATPPKGPSALGSIQVFPVWQGERSFYDDRRPLSDFPAFDRPSAEMFTHISRAIAETEDDLSDLLHGEAGHMAHSWGTQIVQIIDWAQALRPDLAHMTWTEMVAGATAMHQALIGTQAQDLLFGGAVPDAWVLATGSDGWTLQRLLTQADFAAEGTSMGHCIGGPVRHDLGRPDGQSRYWQRSRDDEAIYLSVRQAGFPRATIELTGEPGSWKILQVQGPKDGPIEPDAAAALVSGLETLGVLENRLDLEESAFGTVHRALSALPAAQVDVRRRWASDLDWYMVRRAIEDQMYGATSPAAILHEARHGEANAEDSMTRDVAREVSFVVRRLLTLFSGRPDWTAFTKIATTDPDPGDPLFVLKVEPSARTSDRIQLSVGLDADEQWMFPSIRRVSAAGRVQAEIPTPASPIDAISELLATKAPEPSVTMHTVVDEVPHPDVLEAWLETNGVSAVDGWAAPTATVNAALGRSVPGRSVPARKRR